MPLQQLPTVTNDANAHARLGYVRSQSLASTTTFPVETRGRLGKLLPTSALKNVGKTKSIPLSFLLFHHYQRPLLTNTSSLHPTMPIGAVQMQNRLERPIERTSDRARRDLTLTVRQIIATIA